MFDQIKKINDQWQEYRLARQLAKTLNYSDFSNFDNVIKRAKISCINSWQEVNDHLSDVTEMVAIGSEGQRGFPSYELSRYMCYLIAMEADSSKSEVAQAKTYFAIQTRKQELQDQHLEDQKRIYLRDQVSEHNKSLAKTAKQAWVSHYGNFVDYGYLWLYGMRNKDILKTKQLEPKDSLMDHVGSEELAANLFRATQAEAKIKREWIIGQDKASKAHYEIWKEVRETIKKIWGTMPEKLPKSDHIREAKKRIKQVDKKSLPPQS